MPIDPFTGRTIRMQKPTLQGLIVGPSFGSRDAKARKSFQKRVQNQAEENAHTPRGWKCAKCKDVYAKRGLLEIGHINGKRWDNRPENCGLLCHDCNIKQGNRGFNSSDKLKARVGRNALPKQKRAKPKKRKQKRRSTEPNNPFGFGNMPTYKPPRLQFGI